MKVIQFLSQINKNILLNWLRYDENKIQVIRQPEINRK